MSVKTAPIDMDGIRKERFLCNVQISQDGCWEWIGPKDSCGYGLMSTGTGQSKRTHHANRIMWFVIYNNDPGELHVLHHCDNPGCVRPSHLFIGTHKDNMKDRGSKGRAAILHGEKNATSKLTREQVVAIRQEYAMGSETSDIVEKYNISHSQVIRIATGKNWKHVGGPITIRGKGWKPIGRRG